MPIVYVCVECDPSKDLKGHYFGCRDDGLRDMIWYWDDRDCDATGLPIPPRKVNLPCTVECGAGYYLPYGETACVKCKPGTFSMGGGARFQHFDAMPAAVRARAISILLALSRSAGLILILRWDRPRTVCVYGTGWRLLPYLVWSSCGLDSVGARGRTRVHWVCVHARARSL